MKKVQNFFSVIRYALACTGICVGVLFVAAPFSCKLTEEGIEIVSVDKTVPQILSFDFKQRSTLEIVCSEPVTLKEVQFKKADDSGGTAYEVTVSYNETKTAAEIALSAPTEIGVQYDLTGVAEDLNGNSLTFSLPFTGYNDNPPVLVFSEIRSEGTAKTPEFVELYVLKSGNTAGLQITGGYDGKEKSYSFPMAEVQKGEYITVHFRHDSDTPDSCIDETGSDLALAAADSKNNNCNTARDLWAANADNSARIQKTDVLVLTSDNGNTILDAVLFSDGTKTEWQKALSKELAAKAVAKGIWQSAAITDAASNAGATTTRTLCRQNIAALAEATYESGAIIPTSAADWFVVKTSGDTPGKQNSSEKYTE